MIALLGMVVLASVVVALANMRQPWGILAAVTFLGVSGALTHIFHLW